MRKFTLLFINLLLLSIASFAGSSVKDPFPSRKSVPTAAKVSMAYPVNYVYSSITFAPLSTEGTSVFLGDDQMSSTLPIGFSF